MRLALPVVGGDVVFAVKTENTLVDFTGRR